MRYALRRGISVAVFMIIMVIVLVGVLVPAYFVIESTPSYYAPVQVSGEQQLQGYQEQEVFKGEPNIFYNSTKTPYLVFTYSSVPIGFNVSHVYYFSADKGWVDAVNNTLVTGNGFIPLPSQAFNNPVLIVTSVGNMFLLNPNTSVSTVSTVQANGKDAVYILSVGLNGSNVIPLSVNVEFNSVVTSTPSVFYVDPGTYTLTALQSQVFTDGLTGNFYQWTSVGSGGVTSTSTQTTQVKVQGALVVTLEYKMVLTKYKVTFKETGVPLSGEQPENGNTICPVNSTIKLVVDNKTYQLGPNGLTLCLTYGYHSVIFQDPVNEYFNYFSSAFNSIGKVKDGQINEYVVSGNSTNSNIMIKGQYIFVKGNGYFTEEYNTKQTYYALVTENDFTLCPSAFLNANSTPVLGDLAGQLLETKIQGKTIALGPTKNFESQTLYYPAGTTINVEYQYITTLSGKFEINSNHYVCLLSNAQGYRVVSASGTLQDPGTITLNSPTLLVVEEQWAYGGEPL